MKFLFSTVLLLAALQPTAQTREFTTGLLGNANPLISMKMVKIGQNDFETWHHPSRMAFDTKEEVLYFRNPVTQIISGWNLISLERSFYDPGTWESYKEGRKAAAAFTPVTPWPFQSNTSSHCWLSDVWKLDMTISKNYLLSGKIIDSGGHQVQQFAIPDFISPLSQWAKKKRYGSVYSGTVYVQYNEKDNEVFLSINYNLSNIQSPYNVTYRFSLADGALTLVPCQGPVQAEPDFPAPHTAGYFSNNYLIRYYNETGGKRTFEITSLTTKAMVATGETEPDVVDKVIGYDARRKQVLCLHYNNPYGPPPPSNRTYCVQWRNAASGMVEETLWIDYGKDRINNEAASRIIKNYPFVISPMGKYFAFSGIYQDQPIDNHYLGICYDLLDEAKQGFLNSLHEPNLGPAVVPDNYLTAVIESKLNKKQ